ncbi:hypothetical protein Ancab_025479 [Ancistrocladus abbreviatus]
MSIESVVSAVIQRVGVLLYEEIKFLTDVEGEVNNLSMELKAMQSYLKDAEARQENFDQVDRIKVGEIIKIAYDAEDVIESFILNSMYCSMRKGSLFQKYFFFCCSLVHIHQIGKEVVAIEKRIQVTTAMFERYGVRQQNLPDNTIGTSSTSMISRPRAYPHSDVDEHGKEVDFLKVLPVDNTTSTQGAIVRESCRLAMHEGLQLTTHNSHLRSFVYWTGSSNFDTRPVCENFRFLRVLRIEHYIISELPEALGDLIFLRYLNVSSTKVPRSLGNLHRLLIVDFRGVLSHAELPDVLMKLEQLQYLYLSPPFGVPAAASQLRLPTSGNLQTLWGISAKSWRVKDLEQLSHLRKLFVTDIASMEELESVWKCPSITSDRVHKLGLEVEDEMELSSLGPISHSHNLSSLYLRGSLRQLPIDYGGFPRNLTKLILKDSKLSQDPMPFLGSNLPYLKYLHLGWDAYTGSEMVCKENSFLALEKLELFGLPNLRSLKVENGALPQLKYFEISDGVQIPQRLASLGT